MQKFSLRSTLLSTTGALLLCSSAFADDKKLLIMNENAKTSTPYEVTYESAPTPANLSFDAIHPMAKIESLHLYDQQLNLNLFLTMILKHKDDTGSGTLEIHATDEQGKTLRTLQLNLENLNFTGVDSDDKTSDAIDAEKAGDADKTADATKAGDDVNGGDTDKVADADIDSDKDAEKSKDAVTDDGISTASAASTQGK